MHYYITQKKIKKPISSNSHKPRNKVYFPQYFVLSKQFNPYDVLNIKQDRPVAISRYILKNNFDFLNLTSNVLFQNPMTPEYGPYLGKNYRDHKNGDLLEDNLFRCVGNTNLNKKLILCNTNSLYQFDGNSIPNFNIQSSLSLIIWKNVKYTCKGNPNYNSFLRKFGFPAYVNNFSYLILSNDTITPLLTEFVFITEQIAIDNVAHYPVS